MLFYCLRNSVNRRGSNYIEFGASANMVRSLSMAANYSHFTYGLVCFNPEYPDSNSIKIDFGYTDLETQQWHSLWSIS